MAKSNKFIIPAALSLILAACINNNHDEAQPLVCVSIDPQKWILEQIVGDRMTVVSLMPSEANPENFDPPVSALRQASAAEAYMLVGHLPWEQSLTERIADSNKDIKIVDTSRGINLIAGTHGHTHDGEEPEFDPHTWSSVKNVRIIAQNMTDAVIQIDSANADYYNTNFQRLIVRLDSLDNSFTNRLAPLKGEPVLVWHPSLSYFARDYGLEQIAIGAENKETTLKAMQHKISLAASKRPKVFFVQPQMDGAQNLQIIEATGARKVVLHSLDYDWMAEMEKITDSLTDSLTAQ